jgi:hypothetical protein
MELANVEANQGCELLLGRSRELRQVVDDCVGHIDCSIYVACHTAQDGSFKLVKTSNEAAGYTSLSNRLADSNRRFLPDIFRQRHPSIDDRRRVKSEQSRRSPGPKSHPDCGGVCRQGERPGGCLRPANHAHAGVDPQDIDTAIRDETVGARRNRSPRAQSECLQFVGWVNGGVPTSKHTYCDDNGWRHLALRHGFFAGDAKQRH